MTKENINRFNSIINYLFSRRYVTVTEFNEIATLQGYSNKEILSLLQHLLNSKQFVRYEGKIFTKKRLLSPNII